MMIDSDRHVAEPLDLWDRYLPSHLAVHAPYFAPKYESCDNTFSPIPSTGENNNLGNSDQSRRLKSNVGFDSVNQCDNELELKLYGQSLFYKLSKQTQNDALNENNVAGNPSRLAETPDTQIEAMDATGINIAMLFPSLAMYCVNDNRLEPKISNAFASGYNNWLNDYCHYNPDRLKGVGIISRHDPKLMLSELERILSFGWKTVVLRPEPILGRTLGHTDYNEFWQACDSNNVSIAFHGGTHLHAPTAGYDRYETRFGLHACSHPFEAQMAFLSLLEAGVLERYPGLKIAFLEAGASWLPHWLWRLDEICYRSTASEIKEKICIKPSEYFKRQCWIGFELGEPCISEVVELIGIDKLLYGTDFPHPDHLHFQIDKQFEGQGLFDKAESQYILRDNPAYFFNIT